jgi:hypothetical protein
MLIIFDKERSPLLSSLSSFDGSHSQKSKYVSLVVFCNRYEVSSINDDLFGLDMRRLVFADDEDDVFAVVNEF